MSGYRYNSEYDDYDQYDEFEDEYEDLQEEYKRNKRMREMRRTGIGVKNGNKDRSKRNKKNTHRIVDNWE